MEYASFIIIYLIHLLCIIVTIIIMFTGNHINDHFVPIKIYNIINLKNNKRSKQNYFEVNTKYSHKIQF
jgi:hypothetical protein